MNSSPSPALQRSAAPFARFKEPSELATSVAAHLLAKHGLHTVSLRDIAHTVDEVLVDYERRYQNIETAFAYAVHIAQIRGASEEEMRKAHELLDWSAPWGLNQPNKPV